MAMKENVDPSELLSGYATMFACERVCYIIIAPLMMMALVKCFDQNQVNKDRVFDLEKVANCMDKYTKVNTNEIMAELDLQHDKLNTIYNLWWATMGNVILEVTALLVVMVIVCLKSNVNQEYKFCAEFGKYLRSYLLFN